MTRTQQKRNRGSFALLAFEHRDWMELKGYCLPGHVASQTFSHACALRAGQHPSASQASIEGVSFQAQLKRLLQQLQNVKNLMTSVGQSCGQARLLRQTLLQSTIGRRRSSFFPMAGLPSRRHCLAPLWLGPEAGRPKQSTTGNRLEMKWPKGRRSDA